MTRKRPCSDIGVKAGSFIYTLVGPIAARHLLFFINLLLAVHYPLDSKRVHMMAMTNFRTAHKSLMQGGLILLWGLAGLVAASPAPVHPPEGILAAAKAYLEQTLSPPAGGRLEIKLGRLDPRLRLVQCKQTLEVFQPTGARSLGATSVGVRCPGPVNWTLYVTADIEVFAPALVTTRSLARGEALLPNDVQRQETAVSRAGHGYLQDMQQIEGLVARRPIAAGAVLTPSLVKAPRLIKRGDRVTLINQSGPIRVEMAAEALGDAARGERVRVRTLDSRQIVEGWVVSPSVIKVTL